MSDPSPPPMPDPQSWSAPPGDTAFTPPGTAPMSGVCITAFVFSLLVCLPVINGVVGLVLGIVGLVNTAGGRRRGRGFAIAAIPLSLITGGGAAGVGYVCYRAIKAAMLVPILTAGALQDYTGDAGPVVETLREHMSADFKDEVTPEALTAWLGGVYAERGKLLEYKPDTDNKLFEATGNRLHFTLQGRFERGTAPIVITVELLDNLTGALDNISVGGSSPRKVD